MAPSSPATRRTEYSANVASMVDASALVAHRGFGCFKLVLSADPWPLAYAYDGLVQMPGIVTSYLAEPAVPGAPDRVWRDWVLIVVFSTTALAEFLFRNDEEWLAVSSVWRWASLVAFFVAVVPAILYRRSQPLAAAAYGLGVTMVFGVASGRIAGEFGGVWSTAIVLITLYTIFRWGSGRDGLWGFVLAIAVGVLGNLADPTTTLSDWIGGFIVISIPIEIGIIVRYQRRAKELAISDAKSSERAELARELHDTVAHHVSAIAVQAQAGQAMAATDPERALSVLAVIEEAASRTLVDMRAMVGALRHDGEAELVPQQGLTDLHRLADEVVVGDLQVRVEVQDAVRSMGASTQAAVYRIARESVTNAVRHARGASEVAVEVTGSDERITLTVTDNGIAVHPHGSGYGLLGMAERAEMLGGTFHAGPRPDTGWQVTATFPRTGVRA